MNKYLGAAALAVTAALAVPAFASAHGSVYESTSVTNEVRYAVTNHGYTYVLKETNGLVGTKGMVGYNLVPGTWRDGKTFAQIMAAGGTGAQPHATCDGAAALETEAAIKSWQGKDPFYNYVPFQTESAGLEDSPALWLATLQGQGVTAADLVSEQSRTTKCAALGGTYTPADTIATAAAGLAEGQTKPLQAEIKTLKDTSAATNTTVANLTTELDAAKTQLSAMLLAATPIKLTIASAKGKTVAASGAKVGVAAQPLKPVTVTVSIRSAQARKLKLASTLLGRTTATTAANGTVTVTVKVSKAAAKALKRLKGSLSTTVQATSGDRFATATGKLTR